MMETTAGVIVWLQAASNLFNKRQHIIPDCGKFQPAGGRRQPRRLSKEENDLDPFPQFGCLLYQGIAT